MRGGRPGLALEPLRTLFGAGTAAGLTDAQLLERFAVRRDGDAEAAFAALLARHGPMVRRACRSLLADPNDAEDVFQATFLVLARKAGTIRRPELLGNWLYGTAHRTARTLRTRAARRLKHEAREAAMARARASTDPDGLEHQASRREEARVVHEEVARLPDACRAAVVLCDLEGRPQEEAAHLLRCSDRTLRRRLDRARELLRARLTRRGLAPTAGLLAAALGPEPASAAIPQITVDAIARSATRFAAGRATAGTVPAAATALAEGVITAMTWTKLKAIAGVAGASLALGGGIVAASGIFAQSADEPAKSKPKSEPDARAVVGKPSPADRYRALVKKYDDALKFYQAAMLKTRTEAERTEGYKLSPTPKEHSPAFIALADEFPKDPVAVDALLWVADLGLSSVNPPSDPDGRAFARALEILARDHADEPRVGAYCPRLTWFQDSVKGDFLRAIAERSRDRVVKGRATLALAEYLRIEAAMAEMFQRPDLPINFDVLLAADTPDDARRQMSADPAAHRRQSEELYARFLPDYLKALKRADYTALRRESDRAYDRVVAEFADVLAVPPYGKPARETLADLVRKQHQARPPIPPPSRVKPLAEAFKAAETKANEASATAGPGEPGVKAYTAAAPKWADYGPKMWAIAESAPRSPEAFDALLWIVRHHMPFFDSAEERSATIGRAVNDLIGDHLEYIGDHLDARDVAEGFNHWHPIPAPHIDRIFRALYKRGRTRDIRGRMGFMLAQHRKEEADLVESFEVRGADPAKRPEIAIFSPSYLESLRRAGHRRLAEEAAALFEKVKADYGDVADVNGVVPTGETLATVADRELADIRTLAIGKVAPEIAGRDVEGKPMALSEFRGTVVVLDFGTHEHCGGCKLIYPKQRELVESYKARPFAILGINTNDRLEILRALAASKEVTWRCWWDGDNPDHPGPITTRWNIQGYPTFVVLDHRGVIRFKDLHPFDPQFVPTIDGLIKEAEAAMTPARK